jgi:ABC-2 type transport system permease protein
VAKVRSELVKVRSMPTPRWCLVAVAVCATLGLAGVWQWGIDDDLGALDLALGFPLSVASIVFGVWMFGVEYGQDTMRRALAADPRRGRLVLSKLVVSVALVAVVTLLVHLAALPLFDIAAGQNGDSVPLDGMKDVFFSSLLSNVVYVLVGAAFALLTASMAGGLTAALVFIFIIDLVFAAVPHVGDYSLGVAMADLTDELRGFETGIFNESSSHSVTRASLIVAAWVLGLNGLAWLRFRRSEVQ